MSANNNKRSFGNSVVRFGARASGSIIGGLFGSLNNFSRRNHLRVKTNINAQTGWNPVGRFFAHLGTDLCFMLFLRAPSRVGIIVCSFFEREGTR